MRRKNKLEKMVLRERNSIKYKVNNIYAFDRYGSAHNNMFGFIYKPYGGEYENKNRNCWLWQFGKTS